MGGKTEMIGNLAEEAAETLTDGKTGSFGRFVLTNAFPAICGLIVMGAAAWVTDMAKDHAETKRDLVNFQLETDYKFRRTEEALHTIAAENIMLRNTVEEQQIEMALAAYKISWLHPPQTSNKPADPLAAGPVVPKPEQVAVDWDRLAEEMKKHAAKGRTKISPEDLERLLASKRPLYDQRQMPNMAPAGGR